MYFKRLTTALLPALIACGGGSTAPEIDNPDNSPPQPGFEGKAFTLASLRAQREQQNTGFLEFLSESSFRMGLYHVPTGPGDNQGSHGEDEIKYVVSGSAKFSVNGVDHDAEPGSAKYLESLSLGSDHDLGDVHATEQYRRRWFDFACVRRDQYRGEWSRSFRCRTQRDRH